ncbi:DNA-binding protein [Streptomyces sp. NPDC055036]
MSGTFVLVSEALSKLSRRHRDMTVRPDVARRLDLLVVTSAATLVEAHDRRCRRPRSTMPFPWPRYARSRRRSHARQGRLLAAESLHGHKYAINAMLAATAHMEHGDVTVITNDMADLRRLCLSRIAVEPI